MRMQNCFHQLKKNIIRIMSEEEKINLPNTESENPQQKNEKSSLTINY